jgi:hypothetical protein
MSPCPLFSATIGEITFRLGYQSEAAFSRAFKRLIGDLRPELSPVGERPKAHVLLQVDRRGPPGTNSGRDASPKASDSHERFPAG